jgi:hypothetical protein
VEFEAYAASFGGETEAVRLLWLFTGEDQRV